MGGIACTIATDNEHGRAVNAVVDPSNATPQATAGALVGTVDALVRRSLQRRKIMRRNTMAGFDWRGGW
jgi:hypothetical protein